VVGWFNNFEKGDVSWNFERLRDWSRGCTPPQKSCKLPPTYFWVTWNQTRAFLISVNNISDCSGWFDNSKKVRCLGILSGWGVDPVVALQLRNAADYRLPTFGPHGTKLGHSWLQWKRKSDVVGWFDNSEKGDVSGHCERLQGWSRGCNPPQEDCKLPLT
jgi:hypothetical protein